MFIFRFLISIVSNTPHKQHFQDLLPMFTRYYSWDHMLTAEIHIWFFLLSIFVLGATSERAQVIFLVFNEVSPEMFGETCGSENDPWESEMQCLPAAHWAFSRPLGCVFVIKKVRLAQGLGFDPCLPKLFFKFNLSPYILVDFIPLLRRNHCSVFFMRT